jgi:hypothetical protein
MRSDASIAPRRAPTPWHIRLGVSWSSGSPPIVLMLLVGMALGPGWLAVLTPVALAAIDPALPVALATIGVQLALTLPVRRSPRARLRLAGASLESLVAGAVVAIGTWSLLPETTPAGTHPSWLLPLVCGLCAAMSAALPFESTSVTAAADDVRQLDVLLPAVVGGVLLAWVRESSFGGALALAGAAALLSLIVGLAGWLVLKRSSSETEQRIVGASALLLLGGLADYLSLSALVSGLVAGAFWRLAGGQAAAALRRGIAYVQHPLLVLMLVAAGARTEIALPLVVPVIAYPVLRTAGKLAGAWLARRTTSPRLPEDLGPALVAPGIFGIAFAVNAADAVGPGAGTLLTVVVLGSIASQLMAFSYSQEPRA